MTSKARPANSTSVDGALAGLDRAEDLREAGQHAAALALYEEIIESLLGVLKSENTNGMDRSVLADRVRTALSDAEALKRKLQSDDGEGRGSSASSATEKLSSAFSTMLGIAKSRSCDSKGSQARAEYDYAQAMAMRGPSTKRDEREKPDTSVPMATASVASTSINLAAEQSCSRRKRSTLNYAPSDPLIRAVKDELYVDKARLNTRWDDVVGLVNAKRALQEAAILPILRPDLYTGLRSPPKGVLLYGPPGTGKTMLVRAASKESKCILFSCTASALTSKWHGEGEKLLRTLFAVAIDAAPSIIFFDEVDALLSSRKGDGSEHEASRRFKTECMTQMDGVVSANEDDVSHRVLVLGATNVPWDLDDAVMRRFQRRIYVPLPDRDARKFLLDKLLSKESGRHSLSKRQIEAIVDRMEGYSCSDIVAMAQEAAFGPLRSLGGVSEVERCNPKDIRLINKGDFDAALANTKRSVSDALLRKYLVWEEEQGFGVLPVLDTHSSSELEKDLVGVFSTQLGDSSLLGIGATFIITRERRNHGRGHDGTGGQALRPWLMPRNFQEDSKFRFKFSEPEAERAVWSWNNEQEMRRAKDDNPHQGDTFERFQETLVFEEYDFFVHTCYASKRPTLSFRQAFLLPPDVEDVHLHQHAGEAVNAETIRLVGMHCGSSVVSVRFSSVALTDKLLEGLLPHLTNIAHLQFYAVSIGSISARAIAALCHKTLVSLSVCGCHLITSESLGWLSGRVGLNSPRLHRLKALDMSFTKIDDRGLAYLTEGLGQLECLAMEGCAQLTFAGKETLANLRDGAFHSMRVLNLRGCSRVGDRGVVAIAQAMPSLRHLNLSQCGRITNRSASAIGRGCTHLITLSLEGAIGVTDAGLGAVANNTRLNSINITGCIIARRSLLAVIEALGYVEESAAFFGFVLCGADERVAALAEEEASTAMARENQAAHSIQGGWKAKRHTIQEQQSGNERHEHQAAVRIQSFVLNRKSRRRFHEIGFQRTAALSSTSIQKLVRGWLSRRRLRKLLSRYRKLAFYARIVQARYRGKFVRSRDELVMPAVLALRAARLFEKQRRAATAIQCFWRKAKALARLRILRRDHGRRRRSSLLLQRVGLGMLGRHRSARFRLFAELHNYYQAKMATKLQCFQRRWFARRQLGKRLELAALRYLCARRVQTFCRGMLARRLVQMRRCVWNAAAVEIQRAFRGKRVDGWQELKRRAICRYVHERAEIEHANSLETRLGYTQQPAVGGEEVDAAPVNVPDDDAQLLKYVFGSSFVGLRCLVYWPELGIYRAGEISAYSDRMRLWQVIHNGDDSEIEWLDLVKEHERVLVKESSAAHWMPFSYCRPLPLIKYLGMRKAVEPSNSTWNPQESAEKLNGDIWYCAYVARGLLDECYQRQTHEALQKLRDAHVVKALRVCIAKVRFGSGGSESGGSGEIEQFEQLLREAEGFLGRMNNS